MKKQTKSDPDRGRVRLNKATEAAVYFARTAANLGADPLDLAELCVLRDRAAAAIVRKECNGCGSADAERRKADAKAAAMGWRLDWSGGCYCAVILPDGSRRDSLPSFTRD